MELSEVVVCDTPCAKNDECKSVKCLKDGLNECNARIDNLFQTINAMSKTIRKLDKRINGYQCLVCKTSFGTYKQLYEHCISECKFLDVNGSHV